MSLKNYISQLKDSDLQMIAAAFCIPLTLFLIGKFVPENNAAFYNISPHPYLFISIILSAYYGLQFSLFLAPVLSIQYLVLLHFQTDYQAIETIITIEFLSLPLSIIILSALVGEFKTRSKQKILHLREDNDEKENLTNNLINQINLISKESFEIKKQLVNKLDTTASIFSSVKKLNSLNKEDLIEDYLDILNDQLSVNFAAVYTLNSMKNGLELFKVSEYDDVIDIPTIIDLESHIDDIIVKNTVNTNKTTTLENVHSDKELLKDFHAVLATPIILDDDVYGYVIVYKIPFLQYTPRNFKIFELYTDWLANSLIHSLEFETMTRNSIFNQSLNIYTYKYLLDRIKEEIASCQRYNVSFALISFKIKKSNILNESQLQRIRKILSTILINNTRKVDCVSEGNIKDTFYTLVNMPDEKDVSDLVKRVHNNINEIKQENVLEDFLNLEISLVKYNNELNFEELVRNMDIMNA